ncbi:vegetative incompatibility protein HET-E-1 [Arthroderma uncinatum]|uniref:vegetative incompatibility protein HET-E-1 n=1 Tax=Arthroderma uncinatum TaxID=74035 RepID=UPI00144AAF72|nr:vegetative incompatibility protein HET-E-1 [Arthroderma uncinatum]KAF3481223.1 vegetative incompatibility protein HET-E-1 [Arthroderma uncinatum]
MAKTITPPLFSSVTTTLSHRLQRADAMEGVANIVAVLDLGAKVIGLCVRYCQSVKNAGPEIKGLLERAEQLNTTLEAAQELLHGPNGEQLRTSQKLSKALNDAQTHLSDVSTQLENRLNTSGRKGWSISRLQALKWPFSSKETARIFTGLQQDQAAIDSALQVDQTIEILDMHLKLVISTLPVARDATFDSQANEHDPRCHPNTRVDLLTNIYRQIEDPAGKCIFWLQGMAGTGKSTIARSVAAHFSENNAAVATFFFKKGEGDRDKAALLFTTISSQLVQKLPSLAPHVAYAIKEDSAIVNKSMKDQFEKLILDPLKKCKDIPRFPTLISVVIDALDECNREEDAAAIVRLLPRSTEVTSVRLRFFVTSRPEFHIRRSFKRITAKDLILHEIPKSTISEDISTFLAFKLEEIRADFNEDVCTGSELPPDWPDPTSVQALVDRAVPLFIFASTACDFISDVYCGDPDEQLQKLLGYSNTSGSPQLHTTYLPILNQLLLERDESGLKPRSEAGKAEVVTWFRELVGSIVMLADPLPAVSLARLLGKHQRSIESRLNGLHSVLHIPRDPNMPIKLFHLSFRDFLVDRKHRNENPFWVDEQGTHAMLAAQCLQLLSTNNSLRMDVCSLGAPGKPRSEINQRTIESRLTPEVQYACIYWVYHIKESAGTLQDNGQVYCFLTSHLLHWLEALAILGRVKETVRMLDNLLSLLDEINSSRLSVLIHDAQRGILTNRSIIDEYPLQLYSSAIKFAPEASEVRKLFRSQFPSWITLLPRVDDDWTIFSPDGSQIVTASSYDVKLWNVATGDCIMSLDVHGNAMLLNDARICYVSSVAFSPYGDQLIVAAGSNRGGIPTLQLWDVTTGFKGHNTTPTLVMFSPDGNQLISATSERISRPSRLRTPPYFEPYLSNSLIKRIIFSPDGSKLLSTPALPLEFYTRIKFWSVETGAHVRTFENQVFTGIRTIKTWDIASGTCLWKFEFSDTVRSIAFSPNSDLLAVGEYATITLFEAGTGSCSTALQCPGQWTTAIAFSQDNCWLAAAAQGEYLDIWDIATGKRSKTLYTYSRDVTSVEFSPDGKWLVSGSYEGTVKLWYIKTSQLISTVTLGAPIYSIVFDAAGLKVNTDIGTFALLGLPPTDVSTKTGALPSQPPNIKRQGVGLTECGAWITWGPDKLLWLPPEFRRSWRMSSALTESTVAFSNSSGRLTMITISAPDGS